VAQQHPDQAQPHRPLFDHGGLSALSQILAPELLWLIDGRTELAKRSLDPPI